MPLSWQIILRAEDNRVLAPDLAARRNWSATIARVGRPWPLLAHGLADTHGHLLLVGEREVAGLAARCLGRALRVALCPDHAWEPARLRPVHDQAHLSNTFRYVLDQQQHHRLPGDDHAEGCALPDLVGLRPAGAWMADNCRRHLPRLSLETLASRLRSSLTPKDARPLSSLPLAVEAATYGRSAPGARLAAVHLAVGASTGDLAAALRLCARQVRRHRTLEPEPAWVSAVSGWWTLLSPRHALPPAPAG